MTVQILHVADLHFGSLADLEEVEALEAVIPDLRPDVVVAAGDLCQRGRHGEMQRARAFVRLAAQTAPVYTLPGNHDVRWWRRPLVPFGRDAIYETYRQYLGPELTPVLEVPGVLIAGVLTAHGVAWGSLTWRVRDLSVIGHLPWSECMRVRRIFATASAETARVLVVHHNVIRGQLSRRAGLARWRQAQRRIATCGADVVLCGHDHQESADTLGSVVVSTAGTLSTRSRGARPGSFNFVTIEPSAVQITFFRWDAERHRFQPSDTFAFARGARAAAAPVP